MAITLKIRHSTINEINYCIGHLCTCVYVCMCIVFIGDYCLRVCACAFVRGFQTSFELCSFLRSIVCINSCYLNFEDVRYSYVLGNGNGHELLLV